MDAGIGDGDAGAERAGMSDTPPEDVAGGSQWHPLTAAALVGGVIAAGTGAYIGTRALARRNAGKDGKVNSVMQMAITASDLGCGKSAGAPRASLSEPPIASEPNVPREPRIG